MNKKLLEKKRILEIEREIDLNRKIIEKNWKLMEKDTISMMIIGLGLVAFTFTLSISSFLNGEIGFGIFFEVLMILNFISCITNIQSYKNLQRRK